ncbi:MAG: glycosyltransferase family 4 protein [Rhodospirillaceae bacterium]|nr:glycosyltransferase family 4 protein [Rhodospirillaceae bacterium]
MAPDRPMKILLTVHQFFPEYFSGTEVLTFSVAKELKKRGHEVCVLTGFPSRTHMPDEERFDEYDLEGMRVYRFHHAYVPMGGQTAVTEVEYDSHLTARYFTRLLRDLKPDIVHFFHMGRLGTGLIDAALAAGVPAFYTPTDFWSVCPTSQLLLRDGSVCAGPSRFGGNCVKHVAELTRGPAVRAVSRFVPTALVDAVAGLTAKGFLPQYPLRTEVAAMARRRPFNVNRLNWLSGIVSPTSLMTKVLRHNGVDVALILQSAYGIDIAAGDVAPARRVPGQPLTVGFIGTLARHKGCHILIEAFRKLPPAQARLKVYGNLSDFPDYATSLKALAGDAPNIEFCGTFPNAQVAQVMAGIDTLVVPSLWYENTPLVVYSALAAKRPVVVSDFSGLVEVIQDGRNGLVFKPGDVSALHRCLQRLADEPELLGVLSEACRRPKSSVEYVDELLMLYACPRAGTTPRAPRVFAPLEDTRGAGFITGWAVADNCAPKSVAVLRGRNVLGATDTFLPRPDVRDSLRRNGVTVGSEALGFAVTLKSAFAHDDLQLAITAQSGATKTLALSGLAIGASVALDEASYVGLDSARQPVTRANI